jgi:hypothetical protein
MAGVEGVSYGMRDSAETGGSATGLSATDAWHEAAAGDDAYVGLIRTVARLSFRQKAQNLDSTKGGNIQKRRSQKHQAVGWMECAQDAAKLRSIPLEGPENNTR